MSATILTDYVISRVLKMVKFISDWLKYAELGGVIIVMVAAGIILGELEHHDLVFLTHWVQVTGTAMVLVMGLGVIYMTQFDPRRAKNITLLFTISTLIVANIVNTTGKFSTEVVSIMFVAASVSAIGFMLLGAFRGCQHMKHRGGHCSPQPEKKIKNDINISRA